MPLTTLWTIYIKGGYIQWREDEVQWRHGRPVWRLNEWHLPKLAPKYLYQWCPLTNLFHIMGHSKFCKKPRAAPENLRLKWLSYNTQTDVWLINYKVKLTIVLVLCLWVDWACKEHDRHIWIIWNGRKLTIMDIWTKMQVLWRPLKIHPRAACGSRASCWTALTYTEGLETVPNLCQWFHRHHPGIVSHGFTKETWSQQWFPMSEIQSYIWSILFLIQLKTVFFIWKISFLWKCHS